MSPRRRPAIDPVAVIVVLAAIPAFMLWSLWSWAGDKSDAADAAPPTSTTIVPPPAPLPALNTPLGSLRRASPALARDLNLEQFSAAAQPLLGAVNDRSCVALSVDGYDTGSANAEAVVLPASTEKLVVAAVALEVLGETYTFTTRVVGPAPVGGVVTGDVYVVGGGDPVLSGDWYATSNLERYPVFNATSFDALADTLVAAGVTRIDGQVLGDGTRYDDEFFAPGWGAGVAGLEGGPYDALMANDARVLGDELRSDDPSAAAAREFVRLLAERGVDVSGGAGVGQAPAGVADLASIQSLPLSDVVHEMLTNSDNNTAELMVKEIGLSAAGAGTREAGLAVMTSTLASWGLDVSGVVLADGSGLSLDNRITCAVLLEVLQRSGYDSPIGHGLAVAGQTGTLVDIFTESDITGRLRGKTGTLNNPPFNEDPPAVKALAGYLPVDGGGAVEYVLILNGPTISDQSEYRPLWDLLVEVLATYPSAAGPDQLGPR
ncbi:MAG TPA: D-alanyl-D-alanine carboxypeptidase/D-alanyl-D-alanine-endopeptidase [Ilumatobacteraceae bacterium]|nr:D-alanyl-D-alanine carboxypeptidase/D-alanyl-D-alanine-endopeptidase [Ilumatobacteraceae bacterium]